MKEESSNYKRWLILDKLLQRDSGITTNEIFRAYKSKNVATKKDFKYSKYNTEDENLRDAYETTLRQDILKFNQFYKEAGYTDQLLVICRSSSDKRKPIYRYRDPHFSIVPILDNRLTPRDFKGLNKAFSIIRKYIPNALYQQIRFSAISRLEYQQGISKAVDYSENISLTGYQLLPILYQHIVNKEAVRTKYQPFGQEQLEFIFHPNQLKLFKGRWYCFAFRDDLKVWCPLAIDRIVANSIERVDIPFIEYKNAEGKNEIDCFDDIIGVTFLYNDYTEQIYKLSKEKRHIVFKVYSITAWKRLETLPIHSSFKIIEPFNQDSGFGRASIDVRTNIELYMTILSMGEDIEVEKPADVRKEMRDIINRIQSTYNNDCLHKKGKKANKRNK